MCCYAGKLLQQPAMKNPTLVVVTDGHELDGQLYQQFCMAKIPTASASPLTKMQNARTSQQPRRTPRDAGIPRIRRHHLYDRAKVLAAGRRGRTPAAVRSHLKPAASALPLTNLVVSEEAHRSQYGLKARLKQIKDKETGEVTGAKYVFTYAKHMRDALPGASFIGFTLGIGG